MRHNMISFALMVCGVLALALGMVVAPSPTPAAAMGAAQAPQPSPRPTLEPTPDVIPNDDDDGPAPVLFGRITGTVIDTRTGAPAPNKLVLIGETPVVTDGSGNYDHWARPGAYTVGLRLSSGEGVASKGMQAVNVSPDSTTVLHLFFASHAPLVVDVAPKTDAPTATPVAVEPTAGPVGLVVAAPASLPDTAMTGMRIPGPLMLFGAILLSLGALLQVRPRRGSKVRRGNNRAQKSAEETLAELLRRDV